MTITYTTVKSGSSKNETRVLFDPPLAEYGEVKARLLQMKVEAENALGMVRPPRSPPQSRLTYPRKIKTPVISDFRFPSAARGTAMLVGALAYTTFAPGPDSPFYNAAFHPAELIRDTLPWGLTSIWAVLLAAHSAECVYTYSLCRKHKTPLIPTVRISFLRRLWMCSQAVADFVSLDDIAVRIPGIHGSS